MVVGGARVSTAEVAATPGNGCNAWAPGDPGPRGSRFHDVQLGTLGEWASAAATTAAAVVALHLGTRDRARVRVTFDPAVWRPDESLAWWQTPHGAITRRDDGRRNGVECARVTIENTGRYPVTVADAGVTYRDDRRDGRRRHTLHWVSPRAFPDAASTDSTIPPDSKPFRLEPFHRVTYIVDVHSVIEMARGDMSGDGATVLRGYARVAGFRRPVRSSWRRRWQVPRTAVTLDGYAPRWPVESAILLELVRHRIVHEGHIGELEYASRQIAALLWAQRDSGDLSARIYRALSLYPVRQALGDMGAISVRYPLMVLLEELADELTWRGAALQAELVARAAESHRGADEDVGDSAGDATAPPAE